MKRGKFSLSNYKLFSCDMGELVPCGMYEVLPGDSVQQSTMALVRCAPLLAPVMHPVEVRVHHWFVPLRILWEDFEEFITGGPDGMDDSEFPTIVVNNAAVGSLADYLGVPPLVASNRSVSALPFRAYAMIFNEWYRDQDLVSELALDLSSGVDSTTSTVLQNIGWEKDYFTSSRPWEQKGPAISIPLGDTAPVVSDGTIVNFSDFDDTITDGDLQFSTSSPTHFTANPNLTNAKKSKFGSNTGLEADLTGASAITVNALREAMALQRYEEARARFGSRYVEYLRYLGVRSSDARLQRPEYLGGGRQTIQFSEVLATAEGDTVDVGDLKGHGISAMRSNRYRRFFEEHGYCISMLSVRPKTMYVQGLSRTWNRRTKEDFWQSELQHIGQQEVLNKEVYMAHASPEEVFGYQDRYDEYRRQESTIAGEFRTTDLDYWHMARIFASDPALNDTFVECVPTQRVFASSTNDVLQVMAKHSVQARRLVAQTGRSYIF